MAAPQPLPARPAFRIELTAMARLAAPLAAANFLQMAVHAIDVIFVARLGTDALAAASLSVALFGMLNWAFTGLTAAAAPLISAELGRCAHSVRQVRRSVRMAMWLTAGCTVVGMAICSLGEALMLATGQDPKVAALAGEFLTVLQWAIAPMVAASVLRAFVSALGRPYFATLITALSIAVNALGNYAFIFGHFGAPEMGLAGSALSSVVTSWVTVLAYAVAIRRDRRLRRYRIMGRWWRPEWTRLREIVAIGGPIALTVVAEGGLFGSAAFLMGVIGKAELAAHTVALQVAAFAFQVPFGVGQAATIRVGYHFGAGDPAGIGRAGKAALIVGVSFVMLAALAMLGMPRLILSVYVDVDDPQNALMAALAVQYMAIAAAFQLFDGAQAITAGALRGLQDTRVPMAIALFGYWIPGFGTAALLGLYTPLGGLGVWIGLAVSLIVVAAFLLHRWHRRAALGLVPR